MSRKLKTSDFVLHEKKKFLSEINFLMTRDAVVYYSWGSRDKFMTHLSAEIDRLLKNVTEEE